MCGHSCSCRSQMFVDVRVCVVTRVRVSRRKMKVVLCEDASCLKPHLFLCEGPERSDLFTTKHILYSLSMIYFPSLCGSYTLETVAPHTHKHTHQHTHTGMLNPQMGRVNACSTAASPLCFITPKDCNIKQLRPVMAGGSTNTTQMWISLLLTSHVQVLVII